MHFFYLDETGCTGADLTAVEQPIFVLGGVSVKDQGWVATTEAFENIIASYFGPGEVPDGFELHSHELLAPKGEGPFEGHSREARNKLAFDLLDLSETRSHHVHYTALKKDDMKEFAVGDEHDVFDARIPYLLAFDYLTTAINERVKNGLGHTARGIIILDEKDMFEEQIAKITRFRRFGVAKTHRIKWLVEFSYSIDSEKHPMIQLSDLVIFCVRKFFEMDQGFRDAWPEEAKSFYAQCFSRIYDRVSQKNHVTQNGTHARSVNALLPRVMLKPRRAWKRHYDI